MSTKKAEYLLEIAERFESLGDLPAQGDAEVFTKVTALRGLGEWTAHMFLMFGLGRADVLPYGDLAVQKAVRRLYGSRPPAGATSVAQLATREEMQAVSEGWRPYRSVATWYLWHAVETPAANWV